MKYNNYCLNFCLQLIQCDLLGLFTMALRVCFLLFEGLRVHLKFQMEVCNIWLLLVCFISSYFNELRGQR